MFITLPVLELASSCAFCLYYFNNILELNYRDKSPSAVRRHFTETAIVAHCNMRFWRCHYHFYRVVIKALINDCFVF